MGMINRRAEQLQPAHVYIFKEQYSDDERYLEHQQVYITTDKGYIFLDSRRSIQET